MILIWCICALVERRQCDHSLTWASERASEWEKFMYIKMNSTYLLISFNRCKWKVNKIENEMRSFRIQYNKINYLVSGGGDGGARSRTIHNSQQIKMHANNSLTLYLCWRRKTETPNRCKETEEIQRAIFECTKPSANIPYHYEIVNTYGRWLAWRTLTSNYKNNKITRKKNEKICPGLSSYANTYYVYFIIDSLLAHTHQSQAKQQTSVTWFFAGFDFDGERNASVNE